MNGLTMADDLRRPVLAGWGLSVLAFIPMAFFFPLLVWPLLLAWLLLIGAGPIRAVLSVSSARPGRPVRDSSSFRAPPLA
jgi:hypothetical protein